MTILFICIVCGGIMISQTSYNNNNLLDNLSRLVSVLFRVLKVIIWIFQAINCCFTVGLLGLIILFLRKTIINMNKSEFFDISEESINLLLFLFYFFFTSFYFIRQFIEKLQFLKRIFCVISRCAASILGSNNIFIFGTVLLGITYFTICRIEELVFHEESNTMIELFEYLGMFLEKLE